MSGVPCGSWRAIAFIDGYERELQWCPRMYGPCPFPGATLARYCADPDTPNRPCAVQVLAGQASATDERTIEAAAPSTIVDEDVHPYSSAAAGATVPATVADVTTSVSPAPAAPTAHTSDITYADIERVCKQAVTDGQTYAKALRAAYGWPGSVVQTRIMRAREAGFDIPRRRGQHAATAAERRMQDDGLVPLSEVEDYDPDDVATDPEALAALEAELVEMERKDPELAELGRKVEVAGTRFVKASTTLRKLTRVAEVYKSAFADGRHAISAIADDFDIERRDAQDLVHEARGAGLLPPRDQPPVPAVLPTRAHVSLKSTHGPGA